MESILKKGYEFVLDKRRLKRHQIHNFVFECSPASEPSLA